VRLDPVDLGVCLGADWQGGGDRAAVVLPGRMLGGAPSTYYVALTLFQRGWRVVQVWDAWDGNGDPATWAAERAEAALRHAGEARLLVAKSMSTLLTGFAADRGLAGIWLTPLLTEAACVEGLRRKTAPALLVGGTNDPAWDGPRARELGDEVLELEGADHGLAEIQHLPLLNDAVRSFAARL
jgi:hypothetical protein